MIILQKIAFFNCVLLFPFLLAAQQTGLPAPAQPPLSVQAVQPGGMSLQDAIDIALKNSLGIKIARNNLSIAHTYNSYGIAGGLPFIYGSGSDQEQSTSLKQKYSNPANNKSSKDAFSNNVSASLNASILLFNGGRVTNAKKRLDTIEAQSRQLLSSRGLAIVYNVTLKYFDIVRQQGYARTLAASIEASRQRLEIVKAQQSLGVANNADLFQSQVDLNTQLQNLQAQQLVVDQNKTDLLALLTLNPNSSLIIADTIVVDKNLKIESILNGVRSNPDIVAANQQVSINQFIEKETGALRYPSLNVNTGYNFSRIQNSAGFSLLNQSYGPYAGVTVSIPIFSGFIYKKEQEVAGINVETARLQKDTLELNYTANAVKSWQAFTSNLRQLETAQENYGLSRQLLDLVMQRFQLKQATIVEVKNAQQSFENAGYLLINASFAAKSAETQLKRYANQLTY
jgi:outer membrane protein TolC